MGDLFIIFILILLNGVFSMSEVALISARKSRLASDARKGSVSAKVALKLAEDPDRFLSTIQIGITLIGILTGLFSGAALSGQFAAWLVTAGVKVSVAKALAQTIIVAAVTYLSIVVGELLPKRIGLNSSDAVARMVARPMKMLSVAAMPAVWLLSKSTNILVRLLHIDGESNKITEEEIKSVIREGADAGEVKDLEQDIMFRALVMGDAKVCSIMTPRMDLAVLDTAMSPSEIKDTLRNNMHSSYPVYDATHDNIVGVVYLKDLVFEVCGDDFNIAKIVKPATFMPETMLVYDALGVLRQKGVHCGLVCDEFGSVQGLVTLCDILGGLVGSVEVGTDEPFISKDSNGDGWLVDGLCPLYDFFSYFEINEDYEPATYTTIAGLMLDSLKRIPEVGDSIEVNGLELKVAEMNGARIGKIYVSAIK